MGRGSALLLASGGGFTSPTTIWTETLGAAGSGWESYSVRNIATSLSAGGTQVRVRFQSAGGSLQLDNASIGIRTSNADTASTPVELKFSGASGFTIGSGSQITSDWADLTFSSSDTLIVVLDFNASNGNPQNNNSGGDGMYARATYDSYNLNTVTGFTGNLAGFLTVAINQIEARSAL